MQQAVHTKVAGKGKVGNVEAATAKMGNLTVAAHENKQNMLNTTPIAPTTKAKHRRSGSF